MYIWLHESETVIYTENKIRHQIEYNQLVGILKKGFFTLRFISFGD